MPPAALRETAHGCAAVHTGLCVLKSVRWHSREKYRTAWHREHTLLASSDAHPAAAQPARATHSALSDSSFPSSSATPYRPVRVERQHACALAVVLGLGDEPLHEHASVTGQRTRPPGGQRGCGGQRRGADGCPYFLQAAGSL